MPQTTSLCIWRKDRGKMQRAKAVPYILLASLACSLLPFAFAAGAASAEDGVTAEMLRGGGYVIFLRHVLADQGIDGSPTVLGDCATQRNIGEQGLRDARAIGQGLRDRAISVGDVLSSEYCRALETA